MRAVKNELTDDLGARLLLFLKKGIFERQIKTFRPLGRWRVTLLGGGMMSRWAEGDSFEETLRTVLDEQDNKRIPNALK